MRERWLSQRPPRDQGEARYAVVKGQMVEAVADLLGALADLAGTGGEA